MPEPNVLIPFYDDLDLLKRAVASVPDHLTVYAVDGRYLHFPGDSTITPGAQAWCESVDNVQYHAPPDGKPWGADRPDLDPRFRYDQLAEARYVNYELLPEDEWVLKLDTDEELLMFDTSVFDQFHRQKKYTPFVITTEGDRLYPHRIYVPEHWTFWVDDVCFPREFYPRDTPVKKLARVQSETHHNRANHGGILKSGGITVINAGEGRSAGYLRRRAAHLRSMERSEAAARYESMAEERDDAP